jgi:two-component system chemotaxis response regulator CheY
MARQFGRQFEAEVVPVSTHDEAIEALESGRFSLVLVNRINDEDGSPGLDLIRFIRSNPSTSTAQVMLVSNHAEAQAEAVTLGALPGFGKDELGGAKPPPRLAEALVALCREPGTKKR